MRITRLSSPFLHLILVLIYKFSSFLALLIFFRRFCAKLFQAFQGWTGFVSLHVDGQCHILSFFM